MGKLQKFLDENRCLVYLVLLVLIVAVFTCPKNKNIEGMSNGNNEDKEDKEDKEEDVSITELFYNNDGDLVTRDEDNSYVKYSEKLVDHDIFNPLKLTDSDGNKFSSTSFTETVYLKCTIQEYTDDSKTTIVDTPYLLTRLSTTQCKNESDVACEYEVPTLVKYESLFQENSTNDVRELIGFNMQLVNTNDTDKTFVLKGLSVPNRSITYLSTDIRTNGNKNYVCMKTDNINGKFILENWGIDGYRIRFDKVENVPDVDELTGKTLVNDDGSIKYVVEEVTEIETDNNGDIVYENGKPKTNVITKVKTEVVKYYVSLCPDNNNNMCTAFAGIRRLCITTEPTSAIEFTIIQFKKDEHQNGTNALIEIGEALQGNS